MKAAIYVSSHAPGEAYDEAIAKAEAFCVQHGLEAVRTYPAQTVQDAASIEAFLGDARRKAFEVVLVPFPDCFPTRVVKALVSAKVGMACYAVGPRSRQR